MDIISDHDNNTKEVISCPGREKNGEVSTRRLPISNEIVVGT